MRSILLLPWYTLDEQMSGPGSVNPQRHWEVVVLQVTF